MDIRTVFHFGENVHMASDSIDRLSRHLVLPILFSYATCILLLVFQNRGFSPFFYLFIIIIFFRLKIR